MKIHPVYNFLAVKENGSVFLMPNDTVIDDNGHPYSLTDTKAAYLEPILNTHDHRYVRSGTMMWYLADLVADTYLEVPEGYSRHMVRPVYKDTTPNTSPDNIEWKELAHYTDDGEIVWNKIPMALIDITKLHTENCVSIYESKADLKRAVYDDTGSAFTFQYGPSSYDQIMHGKYISLRYGFDDPPESRYVRGKTWYLLKRDGDTYYFKRKVRKQDLLDPDRNPEGFSKTRMESCFMRHELDRDSHITVYDREHAICQAEDYVRYLKHLYAKHTQTLMKDIPF